MKIIKKLILSSLIFTALFAGQFIIPENVPEVKADQALWNKQVGLGSGDKAVADVFGEETPTDPRVIMAYLIKIFLGFMGLIFLILIIYAGYNWMTAVGNEEKITKSKETLTRAVIGLIIIVTAYAIADYVTGCVMDISAGSSYTGWMCE